MIHSDRNRYHAYETRGTSPLDVAVFDASTGRYKASPYAIPDDTVRRVRNNKGFEALTLAPAAAAGLRGGDLVLTTTEYALDGDVEGRHVVLAWDAASGAARASRTYETSTTGDGRHLGVVEFEALDRSLLVLERDYDAAEGYTIRLFEAVASGAAFRKRQIFEWDAAGLRTAGAVHEVDVDNYEGQCLVGATAATRSLLLVNDDNANPEQLGTQFVLVDLDVAAPAPPPISHETFLVFAFTSSLLAFGPRAAPPPFHKPEKKNSVP